MIKNKVIEPIIITLEKDVELVEWNGEHYINKFKKSIRIFNLEELKHAIIKLQGNHEKMDV